MAGLQVVWNAEQQRSSSSVASFCICYRKRLALWVPCNQHMWTWLVPGWVLCKYLQFAPSCRLWIIWGFFFCSAISCFCYPVSGASNTVSSPGKLLNKHLLDSKSYIYISTARRCFKRKANCILNFLHVYLRYTNSIYICKWIVDYLANPNNLQAVSENLYYLKLGEMQYSYVGALFFF